MYFFNKSITKTVEKKTVEELNKIKVGKNTNNNDKIYKYVNKICMESLSSELKFTDDNKDEINKYLDKLCMERLSSELKFSADNKDEINNFLNKLSMERHHELKFSDDEINKYLDKLFIARLGTGLKFSNNDDERSISLQREYEKLKIN